MVIRDMLHRDLEGYIFTYISLQEKYDNWKKLKNDPTKKSDYIQYQNLLLNNGSWNISNDDNIDSWSFLTATSDERKQKALFVATFVPLRFYNYDKFLMITLRDGYDEPYNRVLYRLRNNKADISYEEFARNVRSVLLLLIRKDKFDWFKDLLDHGADPNTTFKDQSGKIGYTTLLLEATRNVGKHSINDQEHPEYIKFIKLLLEYGAKVDNLSIQSAKRLTNIEPLGLLSSKLQ